MTSIENLLVRIGRKIYPATNGYAVREAYPKPILDPAAGNAFIAQKIRERGPFLTARLGSTELNCLANFIQINSLKNESVPGRIWKQIKGQNRTWTENLKTTMRVNAGFFSISDDLLARFCGLYFSCLKEVDLLAVWYNRFEDQIVRDYMPASQLTELTALEPYFHPNPWSYWLAGRKVAIVHPFTKTIEQQFKLRKLLFTSEKVLPDFELVTIPAVQTIGDNNTPFATWFDAYEHMCDQLDRVSFDVAIIGAGAYGLPLGAFVKRAGKQAIHLGGATQILFGIKGKRWDSHPIISGLYNSHWVRPSAEETPTLAHQVEAGCYW